MSNVNPKEHRSCATGERDAVLPTVGPEASRTEKPAWSILCHSMREHTATSHGCLGRAELFTVTFMGGSGDGVDCYRCTTHIRVTDDTASATN